jgi:hypothetical protein
MGSTYTIKNQQGQYFITCTVHQWADVFTRKEYIEILTKVFGFVNQQKAYKFMPDEQPYSHDCEQQ